MRAGLEKISTPFHAIPRVFRPVCVCVSFPRFPWSPFCFTFVGPRFFFEGRNCAGDENVPRQTMANDSLATSAAVLGKRCTHTHTHTHTHVKGRRRNEKIKSRTLVPPGSKVVWNKAAQLGPSGRRRIVFSNSDYSV